MSINKAKPTYNELLKKTEEQELEIIRLQKKEEAFASFKFFIKESNDLLCTISTDGYFKEINPEFIKKFGYSEKELLTTPLNFFIHTEDCDKTTQEIARL